MSKGIRQANLAEVLNLVGERKPATISAAASVSSAISLMLKNGFQELLIDSVPQSGQTRRIFSGYSLISKLLSTPPSKYEEFLRSSCGDVSLAVGTISIDSDLLSLFHVYESTTFGFAVIHNASDKILGKISIKDLLGLFDSGMLSSKLSINDVASQPIFSLPRGTIIVDCLRQMESRKFRKIQLTGTTSIVTDKQILSYIFNDRRLQQISKTPQHLLDYTLEVLDTVQAPWMEGNKNVSEAARMLAEKSHDSLLTEHGIVTPWDLVIKTWRLGELHVS